ncbi:MULTISPECIES: hypothetical protein [unclassified Paraburkholderia]|uniref:hypothetical protein n=1 Tax=unclassified Paraburkholderia TaxID=2615204 RepID=UPI002AB2ECD1|nr:MULTISPECIES: hypothetical protein [unclassified Paraburkholderia]
MITLDTLLPQILKRLYNPKNPNETHKEADVRAVLRKMQVNISGRDLSLLMLKLRRIPIEPSAEMVDAVAARLGGRDRKPRFVRQAVKELGLKLSYREMIGLICRVKEVRIPSSQISHQVIDAVSDKMDAAPVSRDRVVAALSSLGLRVKRDEQMNLTRVLRDAQAGNTVRVTTETLNFARFLSKKTGANVETVVRRALIDSAFGMLDRGNLRFDARGRDSRSLTGLRMALQTIAPEAQDREIDTRA